MQIDKSVIASLIPHAGPMCLLDEVTHWDINAITALSRSHREPDNPLRSDGGIPTLSAIEYAAQAMAVHGALAGAVSTRPRAGYLVAVRNVECLAPRLDDLDGDLLVDATRLMGDAERVMYEFSVRVGDREVVTGTATVVLDAEGGTA